MQSVLMLGLLLTLAAAAQAQTAWEPEEYPISYWVGPPVDRNTLADWQTVKEAHFTVAGPGWGYSVEENRKMLDFCQQVGLKALVVDSRIAMDMTQGDGWQGILGQVVADYGDHPALYGYYVQDEPNAEWFASLGQIVAEFRRRDPRHLAYINLFPTYASNEQLGTQGDTVTAYREHLRQYLEIVKPDLLSYDHYHFTANGDGNQYFLNLAMIRQAALEAGLPFLNIVQACSWTPSMRIPKGEELRWLVYTSLAYGAQGLSYYVYCHPGHEGAMAYADGTPTALYYAAKTLNRDFAAIAAQLQPLTSLGAYHVGPIPWGAEALPEGAPFYLEGVPEKGMVLGYFGSPGHPTHVVVVNLDYTREVTTTLVGPGPLHLFHPDTGAWPPVGGPRAELRLPPGGGQLLRVRR